MAASSNPLFPGNFATGQGVSERARTMQQLNPKSAPASAPAKPSAPSKPSPKDLVNPKGKYGDKPGEKRIDVSDMTKKLGSFKKGGTVPKTGMYQLHAGEEVVPKAKAALAGKKKKGSGRVPHRMVTEKMDDGSFQITHEHKPDSPEQQTPPPEKFTAANPKQLVKHVRATYGAPQEMPGEE
jgi:hypothetical protein